jgi:hypothetical protein
VIIRRFDRRRGAPHVVQGGSGLRIDFDVQNLFNRKVSDIHFHPAEPRSFRLALIGEFRP